SRGGPRLARHLGLRRRAAFCSSIAVALALSELCADLAVFARSTQIRRLLVASRTKHLHRFDYHTQGTLAPRAKITMADQQDRSKEKLWFPLESNPDLLNRYISKLGFDARTHEFVDVFSTEDWALEMVPKPASAVVVLFPMTEKVAGARRQLHSETNDADSDEDVWYVKQRIRNACGTIAILHALANVPRSVRGASNRPNSWLESFLENNPSSSSPVDKAVALESDATIESFHEDATADETNQTSRGNKEDNIDMHFVAFAHASGKLYELDGRVERGPICHGNTTQKDLLRDACAVVKKFMEADPEEVRFTVMALAPRAEGT
ncbi:hypothetical protein ACHAWF_001449, partial [Thalassiosira exigua]